MDGISCFSRKSRKSKEAAVAESSKLYLRPDFVRERLVEGDLSHLVVLPLRVDYKEWIASNMISFFEHINAISGCLTEFCKPNVCTAMTGPGNVQYQWVDDRGKKYKCTAPQYTDYAMSFTQRCISDETIFPTKYGNAFPVNFDKIVRRIHRLLLHVLAHIYECHCHEMAALGLRSHLNTIALHFLLFSRHFALIENKEMGVLSDLFDRLQCHPRVDTLSGGHAVTPSQDFEDAPAASSASVLQSSALKRLTIRPLKFKENEPNGFARDGLTACTLVS